MRSDSGSGKTGRGRSLLTHNPVAIAGLILAASSFFAAASLVALDSFRGFRNPYMGILTYLVAPLFLVAGLVLVAAGVAWERHRRRRREPGEIPPYPRLDFNVPRQRRAFLAAVFSSFAFLLLTGVGTYRSYEFTESVTFCGKTCHGLMQPEYTAYQNSPHARVACVQCHIGPGATWYVKSKLSGAYQVYATLVRNYPRPIPTPIENLRPAQQTCEQCHWPRKFYGAAERTIEHYLADEANSPWTLQMLLKIGGGDPGFGPVGGIHWHMNLANKVEYIASDKSRQVIPWVRITDSRGRSTIYQSTEGRLTPAQIAASTPRVMDCIDCHNRPTHIFDSPVRAVDLSLSTGRIDRSVPFIKRQAVLALTVKYASARAARRGIAKALNAYYESHQAGFTRAHPDRVAAAVAEVQRIYAHNFFPEMNVSWRVYPDNIGHKEFPGCYRCHDGEHKSSDGRVISHHCDACHVILAQGPALVPSTVSPDGVEFRHPVDIQGAWREAKCSDCHDGALVD